MKRPPRATTDGYCGHPGSVLGDAAVGTTDTTRRRVPCIWAKVGIFVVIAAPLSGLVVAVDELVRPVTCNGRDSAANRTTYLRELSSATSPSSTMESTSAP
jgi:hypothetical protein